MSRLIVLVLSTLLLAFLSGCAQAGETTPTAAPTGVATSAPTEAPPPGATGTAEVNATEAATAEPAETPTEAPAEPPTETPTETAAATAPAMPAEEVTSVGLELVAEGLTSPVYLAPSPDGTGRRFIVDQIGLIRIVTPEGELLEQPFLDVRDRMRGIRENYDERGLLGLAFHPDYASNGRFFVYYSARLRPEAPPDWNHTSHVSEFTVSADDPNRADPSSERILMQIDKPQANHNGGTLAFGPDGYLYISIGDGGGANDVDVGHVDDWYQANAGGNGQDITNNLLGSILRIDVDGGDPYAIPSDNPFVEGDGLDEIFAYGFRNPYRFAFDPGGEHELFIADAGQNLWEEVNIVTAGGNYGWNVKEGSHCFNAAQPSNPPAECPDTEPNGEPLIDPIIEYQNANAPGGIGLVVVGGNVYRGTAIPNLDGHYVFGDWSTSFGFPDGSLFAATRQQSGEGPWTMQALQIAGAQDGRLGHYVLGFGQDTEGEIYVLTTDMAGPSGNTGKVYRLVPATTATAIGGSSPS